MKKFFSKYSWTLVAAWFVAMLVVSLLLSCRPESFKNYEQTIENRIIVSIERDYHDNSVYPIDPVYLILFSDSTTFRTTRKYNVGDTVKFVIHTYKK